MTMMFVNSLSKYLACGFVLLSVGNVYAQTVPARHEGVRVLRNEQVMLEVMDPDSPLRYYVGNRFMPLMVLRAVKDGKDYFYSPVEHDPERHGAGLAMEFDLTSPLAPPGFYEAKLGEGFLKVGVGALRRVKEEWSFLRPREIIHLADSKFTWHEDSVILEQVCAPINEYAYKLRVELKLVKDTIHLNYRFTNTGGKPLATEFYVHTFFNFSADVIGPDYTVSFPYAIDPHTFKKSDKIFKDKLSFFHEISEPTNIDFRVPEGFGDPNALEVEHSNGLFIESRYSGQTVGRVSVHASSEYLCPEQFILLLVEPEKSKEWSVQYRLGSRLE